MTCTCQVYCAGIFLTFKYFDQDKTGLNILNQNDFQITT